MNCHPERSEGPACVEECAGADRVRDLSAGFIVLTLALLFGCARSHDVTAHLDEPFPAKLSAWNLFQGGGSDLKANQGVIPYDLNTPLFSDYASKYRFVWMPPGTAAVYNEDGPFEFPVGTILVKTFAFPEDGRSGEKRIETRLLVHSSKGWVALPYVWSDDQSDATLQLVPDPVPVKWTDKAGRRHEFAYVMPNANECRECHDNNKVLLPIGPKARNLNRDYDYADGRANQLTYWAKLGYLKGAPTPEQAPRAARWDDSASGSLDDRARAYLDNNCAHCHQPGGTAGYTGVDFRQTRTAHVTPIDARTLGQCKAPNSAGNVGGRFYDIVPGRPDDSILVYRLASVAPKVSMPAIGRAVVHEEGLALMREWIAGMGGKCANGKSHP
jgi:uncharacterized repeat protein (TIGR03806 family)